MRRAMDHHLSVFLTITSFLLSLLVVGGVVHFHLPLYRYFSLLRKGQDIDSDLRELCKKRIYQSPLIMAGIPGGTYMFMLVVFWLITSFGIFNNPDIESIVLKSAPISTVSLILAVFFVFLLQKYRVQKYYMEYIFSAKEMRDNPGHKRDLRIGIRLWIISFVTTVLPLVLVTLFMFSSISKVNHSEKLSDDQLALLMDDFMKVVEQTGFKKSVLKWLKTDALPKFKSLYFINVINTPVMILGLGLGIFVALIYSFILIRLTIRGIVGPITELQKRIQSTTDTGNYNNFVAITNNDELGDLAQGFNRMLIGLAERERVKSLFGQYLTREVSEEILNGRVNLSGDHFTATIMFADIRNFTAMSEKMTPEEVLYFLNSYLERMIDVIVENFGIIDKFIGDGILAVFGAPIRSEQHADFALQAALAMQKKLFLLNQEREEQNLPEIKIGIGLHSGEIIAGNIGNSRKMEYTVIGDTVNVASRIESLTKKYKKSLLMSEDVYRNLSQDIIQSTKIKSLSAEEIRGKEKKVPLYYVD